MSSSSASSPLEVPQSAVNTCVGGGYLAAVGQSPWSDPSDYDVRGLTVRGCNRLRCSHCAAMVRYAANLFLKKNPTPAELAALYELPTLAASPLLTPAKSRLYLCRCHVHQEQQSNLPLSDDDGPEPGDATFAMLVKPSWGCAGHPTPALPHNIDGLQVTPENLQAVTAQSLRGELPAGAAEIDRFYGLWAARLYARMAQTPWQPQVAKAVLAGLTDPDPDARLAAMNCLQHVDIPGAKEHALALLAGDRTLFAGVAHKALSGAAPPTLEHRLWQLVQPLLEHAGPAREQAKQDALTPGRWNATIYSALAKTEADWVAAHFDELVQKNPAGVGELLKAIPRTPSSPATATGSPDLQQVLLRWARQRVVQADGANKELFVLLASRDPKWFAAQLEDLLHRQPAQLETLIEVIDHHYRDPDKASLSRVQELLNAHARARLLTPGHGKSALYSKVAQRDPGWYTAHLNDLLSANPSELTRILQAIRTRIPDAPVQLAQAWLLIPGKWSADLYQLLVRDHPQWFVENVEALASKNPDSIPALIKALNDFPSRIPNSQALRTSLKEYAATRAAR